MADIGLDHMSKPFADGTLAVDDVSLRTGDGETVILVGPSGCGKSTCLNMIAGPEDITSVEELAAETGATNVPGGAEQVVARLDAASKATEGHPLELWFDPSKLHLLQPGHRRAPPSVVERTR